MTKRKTTNGTMGALSTREPQVDGAALGPLLYDVYGHARESSLGDFQHRVLERLQREIDFTSAWWGIGSGQRELCSSYAFRLPQTFSIEWERVKYEDTLWDSTNQLGGRGLIVDVMASQLGAAIRSFSAHYGIHHVMSIAAPGTHPQGAFLSLYRGADQPPFSTADCRFLELVMPHLVAAWSASWEAQLTDDSVSASNAEVACAVFDSRGAILAAHRQFLELLRIEWPQCQGGVLPAPARAVIAEGGAQVGRRVFLRSSLVGGLRLVEIRKRSRLDALTAREHVIAVLYGQGRSYRDIAAALGIAANTVRHHLRRIFAKLSISDKTELARLVGPDAATTGVQAGAVHT